MSRVPTQSLTATLVESAMDNVSSSVNLGPDRNLRLLEKSDLVAFHRRVSSTTQLRVERLVLDGFSDSGISQFHGLVVDEASKNNDGASSVMIGAVLCHLAYSTWDGRILYINFMSFDDDSLCPTILRALAQISLELHCTRLVWQHDASTREMYSKMGAEVLDEWLTLRMDETGMDAFLATSRNVVAVVDDNIKLRGPFTVESIQNATDTVLSKVNGALQEKNLLFRRSTKADVPAIQRLVQGLADFEKEPDAVNVTAEQFGLDGFDAESPLYYCWLLEDVTTNTACGMVFFFFGHDAAAISHHQGRFLYLDDLFIEEAFRSKGAGKTAMLALANLCRLLDCQSFVWQALDWNTPALEFYAKIGGKVQEGLLTSRFAREKLEAFASSNLSCLVEPN